ncbi:TPA: phage tail tape measure protein [Klebsiella variicola subsp. variicola]|nr:phage tail tape measure protein [Klebsiella variicola subsp. variicola]
MATLRELVVKISANSSSFQAEIARASRMGADYYKTMENGGKKAAAASRESERALTSINSQLNQVRSSASGLAGAFAGAFATTQLIHYADTWTQLNSRLKLASVSTADFAANQKALMDISQRTGTSLEANTNMFSRMSKAMQQLGYTGAQTAKVTELVATSLRLSGAGASESASVITQFGQAMASGVLRGDEFNSIMENGGRFAQALADGLGVTIGQLRNMAMAGQLTTDKVMPALLGQLDAVRAEGEKMGATVSASIQRVENAFLAWVGTSNDSVGASATLAKGFDLLAANIDTVANAAGVLVVLGLGRFFGNMVGGLTSATGALIKTKQEEVALAAAQLEGSKVAVAAARATVYRAEQARAAAASLEAQLIAERQLTAAQSGLTQALSGRAAATARLSETAGVLSRVGSGVLGVLGGWPGLIITAGTALFGVYEHMQQVHKESVAWADNLDEIKSKLDSMSALQLGATANQAASSLEAQKQDLATLDGKIQDVKNSLQAMQDMEKQYDDHPTRARITNLMTLDTLHEKERESNRQLIDLEAQRETLGNKVAATQDLVNDASDRAVKKAIEQAGAVTHLAGAYGILNLKMEEVAAQKPADTFRAPLITTQNLTPQQQTTMQRAQRQTLTIGMSDAQKQHQQRVWEAEDAKLAGANAIKYVYDMDRVDAATRQATASKKEHRAEVTAGNKAAREAATIQDQFTRKTADLSVAIEFQKRRLSDGQKAAELWKSGQETGTKWTDEQRKAIIAQTTELEKYTQKADAAVKKQNEQTEAIKQLNEAAKKYRADATISANTSGMSDRQRGRYSEQQDIERVYDRSDKGTQAIAARQSALDALNEKYKASQAAESDWMGGVQRGMADWVDNASNYAQQAADATKSAMDGLVNNVSSMLEGNKANWKDWSLSVLSSIEKILLNAALVDGLKALGGAMSGGSGVMGSIGSGIMSMFSAKGNVFSGSGINAYSNSIVDRPTVFAFARGAGIMGEAGPEAVMPLTRGANGRLGVSATGGNGGIVVNSVVNINGDSTSSQTSGSNDDVGRAYQKTIDTSIQEGIRRELKPGGMIWNAQQKR